jgi:DNA replication and repair protein RecF
MLVNGQKPRSRRDLADAIPLTVFTPESVDVIRGGPEGRRDLVMWQMTDATPSLSEVVERYARLITQRNALIRSLEGEWPTNTQREQLTAWSDEVASVGETLRAHRQDHLDVMTPLMKERYNELSGATEDVSLTYDASWEGSLRDALESSLRRDLSRGYTTVGPHRDDVAVMLDGRDARRQASQGEQRSLALAWRLAGHEHVRRERSVEPLLLLDDVFSELDPSRSARLLSLLPAGQTLVTTATPLPSGMNPARVVDLTKGAA